ncbi:MAG TPA: hypothetical protein VL358_03940 [Caulobacteraceae bacterium]|jgi:hypothetical protein|nr:hypothetical protein [Caulobacteraceae bacterium]
MKISDRTPVVWFLAALAVAGGPRAAPAATPPAPTTAPAAPAVTPKLAANVKPAAGYEAPTERLVTAVSTPIFADLNPLGQTTGQLDRVGAPVTVLAKVRGYDWVLVGKDGVGIGYVPRSLLKPAAG